MNPREGNSTLWEGTAPAKRHALRCHPMLLPLPSQEVGFMGKQVHESRRHRPYLLTEMLVLKGVKRLLVSRAETWDGLAPGDQCGP